MLLLLDSYDSFAFNLRSLLEESTGQRVVVVHNDQLTEEELHAALPLFDAVVVGPGPGHPALLKDVGVIPGLFAVDIPLLGICLGFQSLCLAAGCEVKELSSIKHGQVCQVEHTGHPLFQGLGQRFESVRYHSLYVPDLTESIERLAWTTETDDSTVLMAVKHKSRPHYGVQYHPESICSTSGSQLVKNFMTLADEFNKSREIIQDETILSSLLSKLKVEPLIQTDPCPFVLYEEQISPMSALDICDTLHALQKEFVLLNSASHPGAWSIIGLPSDSSLRVTHSTESNSVVSLEQHGEKWTREISSIWEFITEVMSQRLMEQMSSYPFIGGFLGLLSYEEGHHVDTASFLKMTSTDIPDTKLVFVEQCILVNNASGDTFITSLNSQDHINTVKQWLCTLKNASTIPIQSSFIIKPEKSAYISCFNKCQQFLHSGDSYELCLTVDTKIGIPKTYHPWQIYKQLVKQNPSPYSAYFNFDDCVLLSSSPERFLSWDARKCELRPIKGTVRKTEHMTLKKAKSLLHTPKEIGENLMIVDLIRHDLYQLLEKVAVSKLMAIEEYATVYQLVSVISGELQDSPYSGIDVLSQSLPPGSMTGAPKKRSVELLQLLEQRRRGLYSGVCGYWSVEDKADWSVIIRSLFHYKHDLQNTDDVDLWRIGAGGAITVLSECESEWEEMLTKLDSALRIFE